MKSFEGLSPEEIARRKRLSAAQSKRMAKKRRDGLKKYWAKRRKEKKEKEKEKEREKKLALKEKNKKKRGRKKKVGRKIDWNLRKKKKRLKEEKAAARAAERNRPYLYRIYYTRNGVREAMIGQYKNIEDAYERFNQEKARAQDVVFPRATKINKQVEMSIDECILVERTDNGPNMIRNEYGKLVEQQTDIDGWEVLDKFRNSIEETFWVWGYDKKAERKTFMWIYENLLLLDGFGLYEFRRVFTFRNKLLVRYDDMHLEFVICKSEFDAVRLYNELQKRAKADGVKQLLFVGDRSELSDETEKLIAELMEITGWSRKRVSMKNTTYYMTKGLKK